MSDTHMCAAEMAALLARQGERIAKLESQLAARTGVAPAKVAPAEDRVRIYSPPEARRILPTENQLRQLLELVTTRYPVLRLAPRSGWRREDEERDHVAGFGATFRWLGQIARADQLDRRYPMSFWADRASEWCCSQGIRSGAIRMQNLMAAIIAHGDIPFSDLGRFPYELAAGLRIGAGRAASDRWRLILNGSAPLPAPV